MNQSIIVGSAAMLLATATSLAQPAHLHHPATSPAKSPLLLLHSIDTCTPSPPKTSAP
jgi:hypothetical protein